MAPPTINCGANVPKELQTSTDKRLEATVQLFKAANRVHNVINELQLRVNALEDTHSSAKKKCEDSIYCIRKTIIPVLSRDHSS
jgi:flagellar basal body P-ring protein FlgI